MFRESDSTPYIPAHGREACCCSESYVNIISHLCVTLHNLQKHSLTFYSKHLPQSHWLQIFLFLYQVGVEKVML